MKTELVSLLRAMQFTEYEAKAYLALLEKSPLTGYAIALNSGVPRSKIYMVLGGMARRGDILVSKDKTPSYTPLAPGELVARRRRQTTQLYDTASTSLTQYMETGQKREDIWNITGREAIMQRVREGIKTAKRRVLLEIWAEDVEELREHLRRAAARKVEIIIVAYGDIDMEYATVRCHDQGGEMTAMYEGRWIVFSADDSEVVAGIVSIGDDSRAAWTTHPGLVMPITEVIIHDLYIMEIMAACRTELEERFGPNLAGLRQKYAIDSAGKKHYLKPKKQSPSA